MADPLSFSNVKLILLASPGFVQAHASVKSKKAYQVSLTYNTLTYNTAKQAKARYMKMNMKRLSRKMPQIRQLQTTSQIPAFSAMLKEGRLEDAKRVFDGMNDPGIITCTAMIAAYCKLGRCEEGLGLFRQLLEKDMHPDKIIFVTILNACSSLCCLAQGKHIHACIIRKGFDADVVVATSIVYMYGKCDCMVDAARIFVSMHIWDVVAWNAMISLYSQQGHQLKALHLIKHMEWEELRPNKSTFVAALNICATLEALAEGKLIHSCLICNKNELEPAFGIALVDMYGNCGSLDSCWQVFDKIRTRHLVLWNAMLAAYVKHGHGIVALNLFDQMQLAFVRPDEITFTTILNACLSQNRFVRGTFIHACLIGSTLETDDVILSVLVRMYGKFGNLVDAHHIFCQISRLDVVSWTSMILACGENGYIVEALYLFQQMQLRGVKPDVVIVASILNACSNLAALAAGKWMHSDIIGSSLELSDVVGCTIVNMYGKCGCLHEAKSLFVKMKQHDQVSWSSMIAAYSQHGHLKAALHLLILMQQVGLKPNEVTYTSIFTACSRDIFLDGGHHYFVSMGEKDKLTYIIEHYCCIVDLLGRAGWLDQAEDFMCQMPFEPDIVAWMSMLNSCSIR